VIPLTTITVVLFSSVVSPSGGIVVAPSPALRALVSAAFPLGIDKAKVQTVLGPPSGRGGYLESGDLKTRLDYHPILTSFVFDSNGKLEDIAFFEVRRRPVQ